MSWECKKLNKIRENKYFTRVIFYISLSDYHLTIFATAAKAPHGMYEK